MIEVTRAPEGADRCCFCRRMTPYWFKAKDVACCARCAEVAEATDVPSKQAWFRREQIAEGNRGPKKAQMRKDRNRSVSA